MTEEVVYQIDKSEIAAALEAWTNTNFDSSCISLKEVKHPV